MITEVDIGNYSGLNQITLFLFYKLKEKDMGISPYGIQKTLFKLKMELGEDHLLSESIPYYWYYHGPFSETLKSTIDTFTNSKNFLEKYKSLYKLNEENYNSLDKNPDKSFSFIFDFYPEVDEVFVDLISNKDRFYNLDQEVYQKYAPYSFMYPYKFEIYNPLDNDSDHNGNIDTLISKFYECESKLPYDGFFDRYEEIYSNFIGIVDKLHSKDLIEENFGSFKSASLDLWNTFAPGLGYKNHDDHYNYKKKVWAQRFEVEMNKFTISLKYLEDLSKSQEKVSNKNHSANSRNFVLATIEAYLQG